MKTKELFDFVHERHDIYLTRENGYPKPWTTDPILQQYRFTNVYRELDTQTIWFADNWRNDHDVDCWFAALVFRLVNWHETAEELGYPTPWKSEHFINVLNDRKAAGKKVYSGAYMISTHGIREAKAPYLAKSLSKIWANRVDLRWRHSDTLNTFHERLMKCFDVGSFLAAQVVADVKYTMPIDSAADWWTFAASGPGSRRGLNRVMSCPVPQTWGEGYWRMILGKLQNEIDPLIKEAKMPRLHAQDLQNCLCEFDKYERVRLGEGRPKAKYPGGADVL